MSEFRKVFEEYGGDYDVTMTRFLGKEALYLKVLNMLPGDENLKKLSDALASGDLDGAFEAIHTFKGIVGNLGLTPLCEAVDAIVAPLRDREARDDYPLLYQSVQTEYQKVEVLLEQLGGGGLA